MQLPVDEEKKLHELSAGHGPTPQYIPNQISPISVKRNIHV